MEGHGEGRNVVLDLKQNHRGISPMSDHPHVSDSSPSTLWLQQHNPCSSATRPTEPPHTPAGGDGGDEEREKAEGGDHQLTPPGPQERAVPKCEHM